MLAVRTKAGALRMRFPFGFFLYRPAAGFVYVQCGRIQSLNTPAAMASQAASSSPANNPDKSKSSNSCNKSVTNTYYMDLFILIKD